MVSVKYPYRVKISREMWYDLDSVYYYGDDGREYRRKELHLWMTAHGHDEDMVTHQLHYDANRMGVESFLKTKYYIEFCDEHDAIEFKMRWV